MDTSIVRYKLSPLKRIVVANPIKRPSNFKELEGYLTLNGGKLCFIKHRGFIYKIKNNGGLEIVCRNIDQLTLEEYLQISLKN